MLYRIISVIASLSLAAGTAIAQNDEEDREDLHIAAIEALISAPPERALPVVTRVLQGNYSDEVKENALFILSQIETPEAQAILLDAARNTSGELQEEAIIMVGIGGDEAALAGLRELYATGDKEVKEAVMEAYMISGESEIILEMAKEAAAARDADGFEAAVEMLASMYALDELRELKVDGDLSEGLIDAFAVAGDFEGVREIALDSSDPDAQVEAIGALGIIGSDEANQTLMQMYREADDDDVREAALEGMLISGYDEGIIDLYRETDDHDEKRDLLEFMAVMGSDDLWQVIDEALQER